MTRADGQGILKRLDVMIAMLIQMVERNGQKLSTREQIGTLADLGLRPIEIAHILGKKTTYINKELSGLRRRKKG